MMLPRAGSTPSSIRRTTPRYQGSGFIYFALKKAARLWWGPFQGGHGAVYASIDGQSDGYPIAECDNASRVIKYVAVLGYCYSSYDVVTMRIRDITVIADLDRHDPAVPDPDATVAFDGTCDGCAETRQSLLIDTEELQDTVVSHMTAYWTGPWPVYHVVFNWIPIPCALIKLHFGFDFLPPFVHIYFEDCEMQFFVALSTALGISEENELAVYTAAASAVKLLLDSSWFNLVTITRITMAILGWLAPGNPTLTTAFYVASVAYAMAVVATVVQTMLMIMNGKIEVLAGVLGLFDLGWAQIIPWGIGLSAFTFWRINRELRTFEAHNGLVSDNDLLKLNQKARLTLYSLWLSVVMGAYLIGSALLIAVSWCVRD